MQRLMIILVVLATMTLTSAAWPNDSKLVLEYDRIISAIADKDNTIEVRLFDDGLVTVHKPLFTRPSGDFSFQMSETEMEQLLQRLDSFNLDQFDTTSVQLEIEQIQTNLQRQANAEYRYISDPEAVRVRIHRNDASSLRPHLFSYFGPRRDATLYPQIDQLNELQNVREVLAEIAVDPRLQPVGAR